MRDNLIISGIPEQTGEGPDLSKAAQTIGGYRQKLRLLSSWEGKNWRIADRGSPLPNSNTLSKRSLLEAKAES